MTKTLIGETIGKYQIIESVGSGGMAEVYRALQQPLERDVAIKVLHPHLLSNQDLKNRFFREAKAIASLRHPNIIQIYDYDVFGETYFMAMEFLHGRSLEDYIYGLQSVEPRIPPIPTADSLSIAKDIASALAYSHKQGMVHRDVKPANIMRTAEGGVILTDFGIATMLDATRITRDGATSGTPAYMSPEQALGQQGDHRSDIYSLGAVLYELVTGRQPFESDTLYGLIMKQVNEPPPPPSSINGNLNPLIERVIEKAMAKEPDERYQTADEFESDLQQVMMATSQHTSHFSPVSANTVQPTLIAEVQQTMSAQDVEQIAKKERSPYRSPMIAVGVAVLLLVLGVLAFRFELFFPLAQVAETVPDTAVSEDGDGIDSMTADSVDSMTADSVDSMAADGVDSMATMPNDQSYTDDFDDNGAVWLTTEDELISRAVTDGVYKVQLNTRGRAIASMPENLGQYGRFAYTVEARLADGQAESGYGLVFHQQDNQNYYVFAINGMQQWSIWRLRDGSWQELRQLPSETWTFSDYVAPAGETNLLTIEVLDNVFNLFVNDHQLLQLEDTDASFTNGHIGFYTASSRTAENALTAIEFDNVELKPIEELTIPAMTNG